jgi:hypothetical protein
VKEELISSEEYEDFGSPNLSYTTSFSRFRCGDLNVGEKGRRVQNR